MTTAILLFGILFNIASVIWFMWRIDGFHGPGFLIAVLFLILAILPWYLGLVLLPTTICSIRDAIKESF